jgi:hypothetical protein
VSGGPQVVPLNAVAVGTSETVIATFPASSWDNNSGNLIELLGMVNSPATAGTLAVKVRQGTTIAGAQVGQTINVTCPASAATPVAAAAADSSAFGQVQAGGTYCVTGTYAAAAGATVTGVATFETVSPVD